MVTTGFSANYVDHLQVGQRVKFSDEKKAYRVRAASKRYAVCTKPFNVIKDGVLYTIIDFHENVRGRENLIFCAGFVTDEKCAEALARLEAGESQVSHRHRILLNIEAVQ